MTAQSFNFSIDVPLRSDWANVDLLRTAVLTCFTAVFRRSRQRRA